MIGLASLAKKLFGSANDRKVKAYRPRVAEIAALEPELEKLTDEELRGSSASNWPPAPSSTTSSSPPSPPCARRPSASSASVITTCR